MTSAPKLKFKKNILSSPRDSISIKELLERLDTLSTELSKIEQNKFDISTLTKYKEALVNKKLINHKDIGVQALVACCLSDILRIYAPDAPYTNPQLIDIFKLFIRQFKLLSDPENGYWSQQYYLITRLAEVRSIILVTDIDDNTQLIEEIFELFYDSNNKFGKKLEPIICDILIEIISEWNQITTKVLKLILNRFLASRSANAVSSSLTSSYSQPLNFTLSICNANPDRLARQLTKFFSEILFENNDDESSEVSFKSLEKIHILTIEIWKNVPEILGSVMGLIDDELNAENIKFRSLATSTVGQILATSSRLNFVTVHKETWFNWMKKNLDISPNVRIEWVEQTAAILRNRTDILQDISNGLAKTLIDTNERVRLSTVKTLSNVPRSILLDKLENTTILYGISQLTREKNPEIRQEAISIYGDLFNDSYNDLYSKKPTKESYKLIEDIPSQLLNLYYINDKNINVLVDITLLEKILPQDSNDFSRVQRITDVFSNLDEKAKSSFIAFNKRQQQLSNVLGKFLDFAKENNGNEDLEDALKVKIQKTIDWLAVTLPDSYAPKESLRRFVQINNRRLYYLLTHIISPDSDYETLRNSIKEFFTRIRDPKIVNSSKVEGNFQINDIFNTFKLLIYRSSLMIFNRSNIAPLLKLNNDDLYAKSSQQLIDNISNIIPTVFQNQVKDLVDIIKDSIPGEGQSKVNILKPLFHIFRKLTEYVDSKDYDFFDKIIDYGKMGNADEAKYSVKIISLSDKGDVFSSVLFESLYPLDSASKLISTQLAVVAQLYLTEPSIPEERSSDLTSFLIKDILLTNAVVGKDSDPAWVNNDELNSPENSALYAKINALRIFTNRLRSLAESEIESDESINSNAERVLKLLIQLIGNGGEIVSSKSESYPTPKHYQTRLRLEAGLNLLKLAKYPRYNKLIKPSIIEKVVLLIQDENENVRSTFILKLTKYLKNEEISLKFLPLVYYCAYEPNAALKSEIKTWIKSSFSRRLDKAKQTDIIFEKSLTGLIYIIAHHDEFIEYINEESDEGMLKAFSFSLEFISFFLDGIATEQNISLLYYFATRIKQYRDASFSDEDFEAGVPNIENIYKVADLAQLVIKELQITKGWTIQTYPGKIDLSSETFKSMKTTKEGQDVVTKSFIPESILEKLKNIVKSKMSTIKNTRKARQRPVRSDEQKVKIPKAESSINHSRKKYSRKAASDSEDDVSEDKSFVGKTGRKDTDETIRKSSRTRASNINYVAPDENDGEDEDEQDEEEDSADDHNDNEISDEDSD